MRAERVVRGDVLEEILHKGPNQMTVPQAKRIAEGEGKVYL
jgi:hypothetical protein